MKYLLAAFILLALNGAWANEPTRKVEVSLVPDVSTVSPGETFQIGFHQRITPGWHTYWRNPGDSGAATTLAWQVPEGVTVSEIRWPVPERIPYGPLMNFGYHDEVTLLMDVMIPKEFKPETLTLTANARWLVCEEICIPEEQVVTVSIPVGESSSKDPAGSLILDAARHRLPQSLPVTSQASVVGNSLELMIGIPGLQADRILDVQYFPYEEGVIDYPEQQISQVTGQGISLSLVTGWLFEAQVSSLDGILVVVEDAGERLQTAFHVQPVYAIQGVAGNTSLPVTEDLGLLWAMLFALLGGAILNLMPCVFPVLSIKVLSLVSSTGGDNIEVRRHGLVYLAGVVISFVAVAALLLVLRAAGGQLGWGFQLQSPIVISLLAYLFLLIGLSLSGFYEIGGGLMSTGERLSRQSGYGGSFFTGVLAAIVAAPCTAPFMGAAIGYAVTQSSFEALVVFGSLGLGMGLPYVLLCYSPALLAKLPRPGAWMIKLREFLAFPMYASAIWLLWVLSIQTGPDGLVLALIGMLMLTLGIWLWRQAGRGIQRVVVTGAAVSSLLVALALVPQIAARMPAPVDTDRLPPRSEGELPTLEYSRAALLKAQSEGPVFVNFTAAWCITCKVNELNALRSSAVARLFEETGVTYLKGDWTNEDPVITEALAEFGRSGVPLYLLYPRDGRAPEVLPQILTESIVIDAVKAL